MELLKTQEAILKIAANFKYGIGGHIDSNPTTASFGMSLGEIPFDPELHDIDDVMIGSIMEPVTGQPHVEQTLAYKPFEMAVVIDGIRADEHMAITEAKITTVGLLARAIEDSVPDPADRVFLYKYGDSPTDSLRLNTEKIRTETELLDICRRGLTFVVGDFMGVSTNIANVRGLEGSVAVKVNHATGLEIPSGIGVISLGGSLEVDTNNPNQLRAANTKLRIFHQMTRDQLEASGLEVAQIIVSPRFRRGIDISLTDTTIALAIEKAYAKNKH